MIDVNKHIERMLNSNALNPHHAEYNAGVEEAVKTAIPQLQEAKGNLALLNAHITNLRQAIEKALENPRTPIPETIEAQLDSAFEIAKLFNIEPQNGDKSLPTKEQLRKAIMKEVGQAEWEKIKGFKEPTLLLVPYPTSLDRYEKALNSNECKTPVNANDAYISDTAKEIFNADTLCVQSEGKIKGYQFVIAEGPTEMTGQGAWNQEKIGDAVPTNQDRINLFENHYQGTKISGLNQPAYIVLQMLKMKAGTPVDEKTWTLLTKAQIGRLVARGGWYPDDRDLNLGYDVLGNQNRFARVRASVMGNIEF